MSTTETKQPVSKRGSFTVTEAIQRLAARTGTVLTTPTREAQVREWGQEFRGIPERAMIRAFDSLDEWPTFSLLKSTVTREAAFSGHAPGKAKPVDYVEQEVFTTPLIRRRAAIAVIWLRFPNGAIDKVEEILSGKTPDEECMALIHEAEARRGQRIEPYREFLRRQNAQKRPESDDQDAGATMVADEGGSGQEWALPLDPEPTPPPADEVDLDAIVNSMLE